MESENAEASIQQACAAWLSEVQALARIDDFPEPGAPVQQFYEMLLHIRGRLDRVDELLGQASGLRGSTDRRARDLHDFAEDAFDQAADTARRLTPVRRDFEGARERYADWNLSILPQRQAERQMRRIASLARETEDRIRLAQQGLTRSLQVCQRALGYLQWETNLERGG